MNQLNSVDRKMTDILSESSFTISAEVIPPRNGSPQDEILNQIKSLVDAGAEFLSVTKGAGGSLRGGSLPIAQAIKEYFRKPVIAHFTCRDLSPEEVENQLMDHHYFGVRNILALRGDPPQGIADWKPNPKSYPYAHQLISQIKKLNQGVFFQREGFKNQSLQTDFCIGAAAYPDEESPENRIQFFLDKFQAGAQFGITQMAYDADSYSEFCNQLAKKNCNIPILVGTRLLKTQKQALNMIKRFQIKIPSWYLNQLPENEDAQKSLELFIKLAQGFKKSGAPGIHVFVLSDTIGSSQAIRALKET